MREIKFRAWHELGKNFKSPGMICDSRPGDCLTWLNQGQKIAAIMQYTGLKDRNGVEIYEGDIVRRDSGYEGDCFIDKCNCVVEWDDGGFALLKKGSFIATLDSCEVYNWGIEIIGNIYENPELLNG